MTEHKPDRRKIETTLEEIDNIINSALLRFTHKTPSSGTVGLVQGLGDEIQEIKKMLVQQNIDQAKISDKLNPESDHYILQEIESKLKPISNTYETASSMGKWLMTGLVSLSLVVGVVWAILQITATKVAVTLP